MAEVTNELIYEVLTPVQARLSNVDDKIDGLAAQMHAMRGHIASIREKQKAMNKDIESIYLRNQHMDNRLTRIERRLDIIDEPAQ